ncbi:MAG: hypothetical protein MJ168_12875 [Clostridia bacterium]|nr:hypothetical protein [Clostridia bacterium]
MAYDFVRWGVALVIFVALIIILIKVTKNKAKSILIASFSAIIAFGLLLLVPIENFVYSFKSVEQIYSYRYHEKLLTYAECDDGVMCVGQKDEFNYVYYTFDKENGEYKLPKINDEKMVVRSSKYGIYMIKQFKNQTLILTQAKDSQYNGNKFKECELGYYYYTFISDGVFNYNLLTCSGEKVQLM